MYPSARPHLTGSALATRLHLDQRFYMNRRISLDHAEDGHNQQTASEIRSIILVDFFYLLTTKFKRLKSQRFEDCLCIRHQVKNGGGGGGYKSNNPNLLGPID
jgi:hypothetical protein